MKNQPGALSDLNILDLCDEKGQLMGKLLGEMGARVIKIEPPGGAAARGVGPYRGDSADPEESLYFWAYNSAKEGITLDLESADGRRIFERLAAKADIVLESFDPGHMDTLGLGFDKLSGSHSELIVTSLTGFGQDGPYRDYQTSDIVALAMGGVMHSCGYDDVPGSPPIGPSGGHGYMIGAHYGVIGTLMALNWRDMTGEGQHVDASIHEACSASTEWAVPLYIYMQQVVHRQTARHHGVQQSPRTMYPTSDGRFINVFAVFNRLDGWRTLVDWMDSEGMAEDLSDEPYADMAAMRVRTSQEVGHFYDVLSRFIKAHTADQIYRGAQQRKFPWGIVRSPDETLDDPHLWDRGFFEEVEHPELGTSYVYAGRSYVFNKTPWRTCRAPLLGEHNRTVYIDDLGISEGELERLQGEGVI